MKNAFIGSPLEPTLYIKHVGNDILIFFLYVDDLIFIGDRPSLMEKFKEEMKQAFEMLDLVLMRYFIGLEVQQQPNDIFISQTKYVVDLLKWFRMMSSTSIATPVALGEKLTKDDPSPHVDPT